MIVLFTDFGLSGPYVGQMSAVVLREAPDIPLVSLYADAPAFDPRASAYLLSAYIHEFPEGAVFLCVVDPGVGAERAPIVVQADGRWFVGPDNGLFNVVAMRSAVVRCWDITWRPTHLSNSFHGRDLFAPVAARIARTGEVPGIEREQGLVRAGDWPLALYEVIYIDHYGNAMTGVRAADLERDTRLNVKGHELAYFRTFAEAPPGVPFWYENANALVEIAVNRGDAARLLGLSVGTTFNKL